MAQAMIWLKLKSLVRTAGTASKRTHMIEDGAFFFALQMGRECEYTNIDARLLETTCVNCMSPMVAEQDKNGDYWPLR